MYHVTKLDYEVFFISSRGGKSRGCEMEIERDVESRPPDVKICPKKIMYLLFQFGTRWSDCCPR